MSESKGWWESRLGLKSSLRSTLDEQVPGGAKFTYTLGSATLLTFLVLCATGLWQLFYYVPSTSQAYDSLNYLRFQVPFGWLVHGLHFWAANLMVVLAAIHLAQVFIWGAFKKPRELTWILGVGLFLATIAAVFTGGPLAWDEKGYWAARVGAGLAGSIPVIGSWLQHVVFGGETLGQLSLSRLFGIHTFVVPIILLLIFALHMVAFRKGGAAGSIKASEKVGAFWPEQVIMDTAVFAGLLTLMVWASAWLLTPVTGLADPIDATYVARPDWPFLWLFQLLKYVPGSMEWVVVAIVPLVGVLLLLAVPWLDRKSDRRPAHRPVSMAVFAVVVVAVAGLTYAAYTAPAAPIQAPTGAPGTTPESAIEPTPTVPGPSVASYTIGGAEHGQGIFVAYCQECHGVEGKGGVKNDSADGTVPPLNPMDPSIASKDPQTFVDNMEPFLQNGSIPSPETTGGPDPKLKMPSFGNTYALTQAQIADVEAYVMQLNGVKRAVISNPGVAPKKYAWWTLGGFAIVAVMSGIALVAGGRRQV